MSTTPNNPFESNQPNQGNSQGPAKKGSNVWLWVVGIIGGVVVLGGLVCCGGGYMLYRAGTGVMSEAFKQQLIGNAVIDEHIGEIESLEMNLGATSQAAEGSPGSIAFDIKGSKGSGTILIRQDPGSGDGMGIATAELKMPDGTTYNVDIKGSDMVPDEMDEIDIDLGEADEAIDEARKAIENAEAALQGAGKDQ